MDHDELNDEEPLDGESDPMDELGSDSEDDFDEDEDDALPEGYHVEEDDYEPPTDF